MKTLMFILTLALLFMLTNNVEARKKVKFKKRQLMQQNFNPRMQNPQNPYPQEPIFIQKIVPVTRTYYQKQLYQAIPFQVQVPNIPVKMPDGKVRLIEDPYLRLQLIQAYTPGFKIIENQVNNAQNNNANAGNNYVDGSQNSTAQEVAQNPVNNGMVQRFAGGAANSQYVYNREPDKLSPSNGVRSRNSEGNIYGGSCCNNPTTMNPLQRKINKLLNKMFIKKKKQKQMQASQNGNTNYAQTEETTETTSCEIETHRKQTCGTKPPPVTLDYVEIDDEFKDLNKTGANPQKAASTQKPSASNVAKPAVSSAAQVEPSKQKSNQTANVPQNGTEADICSFNPQMELKLHSNLPQKALSSNAVVANALKPISLSLVNPQNLIEPQKFVNSKQVNPMDSSSLSQMKGKQRLAVARNCGKMKQPDNPYLVYRKLGLLMDNLPPNNENY